MDKVIWKSYSLSELFDFDSGNQLSSNRKALNVSEKKDEQHKIALITQSEKNNGITGYLEDVGEVKIKKMINYMTYSMHFGLCFYHDYDFVLMDTHGSVFRLIPHNNILNDILCEDDKVNYYFSKIITKVCSNGIYNYSWLPNSTRVGREIILLPCLEVSKNDNWIWEENGKHWTLAVDYIKKLMDEAKGLREQKTIRLYEAEKKKYEAEKKKYEAEYLKEKQNVVWKGYELGDLFDYDSGDQLSSNKKALNVSKEKDATHTIALITQSEKNNGVSGYLEPNAEIVNKKKNGFMTYSMHFGLCFYHDYDFVLMDTHGSLFRLKAKSVVFNDLLKSDKMLNKFLSKNITKICSNDIYNYSWLPNSTRTGREIILLPCIELSEKDDWIWEENGRYWTLATNFVSYLYLQGRCNYYQKLIDKWTYQY